MLENSIAAVTAVTVVTVPAIRLLLTVAPAFLTDPPAVRRERHAFLALLTALVVVTYGSVAGSDKVLLLVAWLNLASSVCAYLRAWFETAEGGRSHSTVMKILLRNREKQDGED